MLFVKESIRQSYSVIETEIVSRGTKEITLGFNNIIRRRTLIL